MTIHLAEVSLMDNKVNQEVYKLHVSTGVCARKELIETLHYLF